MNPLFLGLFVVILASLLQGSFAVPMAYARSWKWENSWMVFSVFGMIVLNIIFGFAAIPNLFGIFGSVSVAELLLPIVFGLVWGLGAIGFGLGVTATGFSLGYAVLLGTVLSMGSFIPMVVMYPEEILTYKGILVLAGLAVTLTGIGISGYAGIMKERDQGEAAGEITKISRFSLRTGIIICIIAGLFSSTINIGFALCGSIADAALAAGAHENWAGNSIWVILFTSGGILNIGYCLHLLGRNKTATQFTAKGSIRNFMYLLLMSLMWIGSFILYGVGATMMGSWGTVIGWSVYMALAIAVANLWGILQGEWKGATPRAKMLMVRGFVFILCAIVIFAWSGTV